MNKWCVLVDPGQVVVDVLLGGGVAPEVDSSRRSHPDQVWPQTPVHASDSLVGPDMPGVGKETLILLNFSTNSRDL